MLLLPPDSVSARVPGGCHSQGCHGYLHALLEAHISPTPYPSLRHLSQAHQLATSLIECFFVLEAQCVSEMTNLMACWKRNGFEDSRCTREVNSFMDCVSQQVIFHV